MAQTLIGTGLIEQILLKYKPTICKTNISRIQIHDLGVLNEAYCSFISVFTSLR